MPFLDEVDLWLRRPRRIQFEEYVWYECKSNRTQSAAHLMLQDGCADCWVVRKNTHKQRISVSVNIPHGHQNRGRDIQATSVLTGC